MNPPARIKNFRRSIDLIKDTENDPIDRAIQYFGYPTLTLRTEQPLQPIISRSEAENPALEVPFFKYDPRVVWTKTDYKHGVNLPGNMLHLRCSNPN